MTLIELTRKRNSSGVRQPFLGSIGKAPFIKNEPDGADIASSNPAQQIKAAG